MDPLTAAAASGMRARMESLDVLANNIANTGTSGFKLDRESCSLYVGAEASAATEGSSPTIMPVAERTWIDFAQGVITATGNPLDVALSGRGFLSVTSGGATLYTRDGNLRLSSRGQLETRDGYRVRGQKGLPILLDPERPTVISTDGRVSQDGQEAGQLELFDFANSGGLSKRGANYFQLTDPTLKPAPATDLDVVQGKLESSNVAPAEATIKLVSMMRQFEMLQRAVILGGQMNAKTFDEVARVGT